MVNVQKKSFLGQIVALDDTFFVDCTFQSCELAYHGGPVQWKNCHFSGDCRVFLHGCAARTVDALKGLGFAIAGPGTGGTTLGN
ncbi:MAG: hypothetical protein WA197_11940 [Candidatus Acidiferrales bacterium]